MQINYGKREVSCKLVYYGPGMSGKTTNLEVIHQKVPEHSKGEMTSIATEGDRTLFFDFLPLDLGQVRGMTTKFQLYTVPGQVYYSSTRKLVLQGADGVIFVADSQASKLPENIESLKDLQTNLEEYGLKIDEMPIVIQWNKRDLPTAMPVDELEQKVNWMKAATTTACAATGEGVLGTLKLAAALILDRLNTKEPGAAAAPKKPSAAQPAAAAAAPKAEEAPAPEKKEVYIAKINADQISRQYFTQYGQVQYRLGAKSDDVDDFRKFSPEEKRKLLESLINYVLLLQDAKKRSIQPAKEEVEAQVNDFVKRFRSREELDAYLARRKLSLDNLRNEATKNVIISKIIQQVIPNIGERLKITEAEVKTFYDENAARFGGKGLDSVKGEVIAAMKGVRKRALLEEFFGKLRGQAAIQIFNENI
ncbi:MAG: SurA N-terminal domain-containing protein [Nitrospinae bacterium]|nr:SurA N-terminal domain-containing protein [Nitrospinota bacterium]